MKLGNCKNCKHWNNRQSELDYSNHYGICSCFRWKFTISSEADIRVLDRLAKTDKNMHVSTFESTSIEVPIGNVDRSRYCFVTEENFGCVHHETKKP